LCKYFDEKNKKFLSLVCNVLFINYFKFKNFHRKWAV